MGGPHEPGLGHPPQALQQEVARGALAQRPGREHERGRIVDELALDAPVDRPGPAGQGRDHGQPRALQAPGEIRQPAQRGLVAPLQVVDEDDGRALGDGERQAVQRVEHRVRRLSRLRTPGPEERGRERRRARERVLEGRIGEDRLEDLAHHAEAEAGLQGAAAGRQRAQPEVGGLQADGLEQTGLADAPGAGDHGDATVARRAGEVQAQGLELLGAFEQRCGSAHGHVSGIDRRPPRGPR